MKRRRWPALLPFFVLAMGAAFLAWSVESQLQSAGRPAAASTAPTLEQAAFQPDSGPGQTLASVNRRRHLTESTARNLFSVERKPPPEETADAPAQASRDREPAPMLDATLSGIVLAGARSVVVLSDAQDGTVHRLRRGDSHRGWTLVRVSAGSALFRRGDRDTRLDLRFSKGAGTPASNRPRSSAQSDSTRMSRGRSAEEPWRPPGFSFPDYDSVNVDSMQGTAGSVPRPARGGPRSSLRRER